MMLKSVTILCFVAACAAIPLDAAKNIEEVQPPANEPQAAPFDPQGTPFDPQGAPIDAQGPLVDPQGAPIDPQAQGPQGEGSDLKTDATFWGGFGGFYRYPVFPVRRSFSYYPHYRPRYYHHYYPSYYFNSYW